MTCINKSMVEISDNMVCCHVHLSSRRPKRYSYCTIKSIITALTLCNTYVEPLSSGTVRSGI